MNACGRKACLQFCKLTIFRTEVMTPMTDAMRLVNRESPNLQAIDNLKKARSEQPLGRDEDKTIFSCCDLLFQRPDHIEWQPAIQRRGWIAAFTQTIDLILHQRNKRRHDNVGSSLEFRGDLIAQRFSSSRRHDNQRIPALQP